jgi:hypothetical protein
VRSIGDNGVFGTHFAAVGAAKAHNAVAALQEMSGFEITQEPRPGLLRTLQQQVVEDTTIAYQRHILRTRQRDIAAARRNETKPVDGVRFICDRVTDT